MSTLTWGLNFTNPPIGTPTLQIVREDNGDIIVAADTEFSGSGIVWSYVQADAIAGVTYRINWGATLANGKDKTGSYTATASSSMAPVTWADAKKHLRLTVDDDQAYVEQLIAAATDYAQDAMQCSLMPQERVVVANIFRSIVELNLGPILSITSVKDGNNSDVTNYTRSYVGNLDMMNFPSDYKTPLTITYQAGYANAGLIPASIKLAILQHVATMYENRESIADKEMYTVPQSLKDFYALKSRSVGVR